MPAAKSKPRIDLSKLNTTVASDKGIEIELRNPGDKSPLGQYITVLGQDSTVLKELRKDRLNAALTRRATAEARGETVPPRSADDIEQDNIEYYVLATVGFRDVCFDGNDNYPFTVANAKRLYTELEWIRPQLDRAIGDMQSFMQGLK